MAAKQIEGYDVIMLFLNPQPPDAPNQLLIKHCVAALYRGIVTMTEGVLFCQMRCHLALGDRTIGALSIGSMKYPNLEDAAVVGNVTTTALATPLDEGNRTTLTEFFADTYLGADSGTIRDIEYPHLSFTYHFYGKAINPKEVSMVVLEALATAAQFPRAEECKELQVISPTGGAMILIEGGLKPGLKFLYGWATRSLKILYQRIIVAQKRWGDVWLEIFYDNMKFGELRMLRTMAGIGNGTDAVE
ncbi:MAG: hypothetical protein L6R39_007585 [Caloplaca ligustica]|nr:MAG: hypothetical protein L6R39_007585 [Caloplaca ligustica]